jgi:hypothetical protein
MDTLAYYEWCKTILPDLVAEGKIEAFDEDESEPDSEWLMDEITTLMLEEGDIVYALYWDSGGPGAGAGLSIFFDSEEGIFGVPKSMGSQGHTNP